MGLLLLQEPDEADWFCPTCCDNVKEQQSPEAPEPRLRVMEYGVCNEQGQGLILAPRERAR